MSLVKLQIHFKNATRGFSSSASLFSNHWKHLMKPFACSRLSPYRLYGLNLYDSLYLGMHTFGSCFLTFIKVCRILGYAQKPRHRVCPRGHLSLEGYKADIFKSMYYNSSLTQPKPCLLHIDKFVIMVVGRRMAELKINKYKIFGGIFN